MTVATSQFDREMLLSRLTASRQWDRLLDCVRDWLGEEPENPRAHRYAAQALVNLDRKAEAEVHLVKALALRPHDPFAHRLMAIVQFDLKRYREADKAIHDAIALDPEDAQNWYQLAWMCYRQDDLKNGFKWISKARELAPLDPDILNLYALCAETSDSTPTLLEEALALDPENASVHNNLGVYYLDRQKDYAKAEASFRRALTLQPTLKAARRNLFQAVKRRDLIYRILCAPRDFLFALRKLVLGDGTRKFGGVALGFIFWIFLARFFLLGLALWFGLVWPLVKFYEFLVIGDLKKKAGEVGATRGGILGYRRWSIRSRLGLFTFVLVGFWTAIYFLLWAPLQNSDDADPVRLTVATALVGAVLVGILVYFGAGMFKNSRSRYHAWRRDRTLRKLRNIET